MELGSGEVAALKPEMADLFDAVAAFRKRAKVGRTGAQLGIEMSQLRLVVDLIEVEFSETAGAFAKTDEYDQQGSVSP